LVFFGETGTTGADGVLHGVVHAVDRPTGQAAWSATVDGSIGTTPLIEDGLLVIGASSGLVYAFFIDGQAARRSLE
jgi:outer membrane protein assembly factor BamB